MINALRKKKNKQIKKEIRILGIDDAPFDKFKSKDCMVIGTVFRGGSYLDGLVSTTVDVDGDDATKKLVRMINNSKHREQLQCIMINGIAVAGFNVIDIQELWKKTRLPVIVVIRKMPDVNRIEKVLKRLSFEDKIMIIKKAGAVKKMEMHNRSIYYQTAGISKGKAEQILRQSATHSLIPEPLRIAHIIASGVMLGENRGRV